MTFRSLMSSLCNKEFALYFNSVEEVEQLKMFAKKYPDIDMVPWHDGETQFSKFVNVMFSGKFKHHVYFLGNLNWLGSVRGLGEYNFDYPVVYWKDIIDNIEDEAEIDENQYFEVLMT